MYQVQGDNFCHPAKGIEQDRQRHFIGNRILFSSDPVKYIVIKSMCILCIGCLV